MKIRTIVYETIRGKEFETPIVGGFFAQDYINRRGDLVGIEQEARAAAGRGFIRFGWQETVTNTGRRITNAG